MRHVKLSILFVLLLSYYAKAQDACDTMYIFNKYANYANMDSAYKILGRVVEINSGIIKYHRCDNLHGAMYIFIRSKASIIKYSNGKIDSLAVNIGNNNKVISYNKVVSDTGTYFHIGIVPYQLFTRSFGVYARYDFKKLAIEYRPTYTYATNNGPNEFGFIYYDNYYFQGINNSFIFYIPQYRQRKIGFILSYKHWWHGIESIVNDKSIISGKSSYPFISELRSTFMNGIGTGIEFMGNKRRHKAFDFNFFFDATITEFISYSHVYSIDNYNPSAPNPIPNQTYPYTETKGRFYFNITLGFKIGYRKQLN